MENKSYTKLLTLLLIILFVFLSCHYKAAKKSKSPWHHFNRGRIYFDQAKVQEAIVEVEKAIKLDAGNPQFYQFLGYIYFAAGKYQEAEENYLKALNIKPNLTEVHNHLGVLYLTTDERDKALQEFKIALEDKFYPTPWTIHYHLSELYKKENNLDEAIVQLRKALEANPKYYRAHYELANILNKLGSFEEAIFEYKVAETDKTYQRDPDFHFSFAMAYLKANDNENAKQHLFKVVELAPGTPNYIKARDILETLK